MLDVRRRQLLKPVGGVAVMRPLAARAQRSKPARIGALYLRVAEAESFTKELRDGMRQLGYVEAIRRCRSRRWSLPIPG